jgi:7-cyano-7-deazaguanine synthase
MVWEPHEIRTCERFLAALELRSVQPLTVLRLPMDDLMGNHWSVSGKNVPGYRAALSSNYIPGRNLSLISKAAIFCALNRIGELALATLQANPFPDAQPQFFNALANAVTVGLGLRLKIRAPFLRMTKAELIRRATRLPFELTVSCIRPRGNVHCGACTKCAERVDAFREAGVCDPTRYATCRS